jgi:putative heme-binding domain-containing protein
MKTRLLLAVVLLVPSPTFGQADAKVPDPDPEIERKSFQVADGFEVNLFAADPLLAKPIQMNWDPQGRLWVASSEVYPQIKPGQKANDKVLILEDTDGDGKADKTTIFADGLLIPTGVEPGDGGAYVANSTELLHLSASQPGAKADRQRVMLSGFGTEDTHHILHTLRWGPEGFLYFNQSTYIHSHIETPHGVRRLNGGGVWRYRPETDELEVFVRGFINPWGHHFDRWGQSFMTDGANGEGITHGVPGAAYSWAIGATRILHGANPGSPKHCGLEVLSGRHLPEDWRGNLITNDFRGHRVCRFVLKEDGATYASREMPELIKTNHPAFRPIDVKMGPDGAIYIADWYNPIIQHGEIDFRDERRDHTHGRIWRVTAKGRPLVKKPELVHATTEELLDQLKAPEDWTRQQAKRVLKERGKEKVLPALDAWVKKLDPSTADHDATLLEGLWTYQGLNVVKPEVLAAALNARTPEVRAAATRVLGYWHDRIPNALELGAARIADDHPRVRLEAVRSLALFGSARAAEVALSALDKTVDRLLDYAIWLTARDLEPYWMPAFRQGKLTFGGNPAHLLFALQSVESADVAKPLLALLKEGKIPKEREYRVWVAIARTGGQAELELVLDRVRYQEGLDQQEAYEIMLAVEEAVRSRKVGRPSDCRALLVSLKHPEYPDVRPAMRLAGLWKIEEAREALEKHALDEQALPGNREAAFEGLALLGGKKSEALFQKLASGDFPPATRRLAVISLTPLNLESASQQAALLLGSAKPADNLIELFNAFLGHRGGATALAKALTQRHLPADTAKIGLRALRYSGREEPALVDALMNAGRIKAGKKELTAQEVQALAADVQKFGDPARGEAIYRRKEMACANCHAIAGAGGQVGPDLASIGASAPVDYLVESILLPNKAVKEGYHAVRVNTLDGRVVTGVKLRETKTELVLRTAEDNEVTIPVKDIEDQKPSRSLMPDGLADPLTRQELIDLVRFLSELGKVGPYAPTKERVVRRWQAFEPTAAALNVLRGRSIADAARDDPTFVWGSVYAKVSGTLPLEALQSFSIFKDAGTFSVVQCRLDVSTGGQVKLGQVKLRLASTTGVSAYVNGQPLKTKEEMIVDVIPGFSDVTIIIDREKCKEGIYLVVEDIPDSPARVSIVGGK